MLVTSWFPRGAAQMLSGAFAWPSATIRLMLLDSDYVPDRAHATLADVIGEIVGSGYVAGGEAVLGKLVTCDALDVVRLKADPVTWGLLDLASPFRWGVLYRSTGAAVSDDLVGLVDPGAPVQPAGVLYQADWGESGTVLKITP